MARMDGYREDLHELQNTNVDQDQELLRKERQNMLDILQLVLPDAKINSYTKKSKYKTEFQVIQRFDPTSKQHQKDLLITKSEKERAQEEAVKLQAEERKKNMGKEVTIEKGIDKKKQRIALADSLLSKRNMSEKKAEEVSRITKLRKKDINYSKLKEIAQEDTSNFKLFG